MGAVYKVRDAHLDRLAALKVLPHDKMADPERKRRFSQEARAASALNHPNIITIYDIGSDDGVDFIAMEYVEGRTLEALLASGPLRIADALKYARQMADGLAVAHAAGILHRDLKPANIMVRENGLVKLLDFGLAKLTDAGEIGESDATRSLGLTRAGTVMGTAAYMSPEQAEGKKLDFRSDIFSFGVVLYEMLAGKRAFAGDSQASVIASLLRDDPTPIADLRADAPSELERIVERCLRKDPDRRVQTMADLKAALDDLPDVSRSAIRAPVRMPAPQPAPDPTTPAVPVAARPRWRRRSRNLWWLAIAAFWVFPSMVRHIRSVFDTDPGAREVADSGLAAAPLTEDAGFARQPSFSPDGTQVAYSWNGEKQDNFDVYVKALDGGAPRRLTADAAEDFAPAWSPDGRNIAFLRKRGARDEILLISAGGGETRAVGTIGDRSGNALAWSNGGQGLIFPDSPPSGSPVGLYELTLATSAKRRLVKPAVGAQDVWPSVSPDGSTIAFARKSDANLSEIFIAEMPDRDESDSEAHQITSLGVLSTHPVWANEGEQLIFASGRPGAANLWRVAVDASTAPRRLSGIAGGEDPAVAVATGRIAYSKKNSNGFSLWLVDRAQ